MNQIQEQADGQGNKVNEILPSLHALQQSRVVDVETLADYLLCYVGCRKEPYML